MTKSCVPGGVKKFGEHRILHGNENRCARGLRHREKSYALRDFGPVETPVAQSRSVLGGGFGMAVGRFDKYFLSTFDFLAPSSTGMTDIPKWSSSPPSLKMVSCFSAA